MSMVYNQIYKCRKCGAEFCPVTVHTETIMYIELNNFLNRVNGELEWDHKDMPLAPRLYRAHTCPNGDIGVGDFIGYQKRFNLPMEGYTYFFTYEETLRHRHRDLWQMPCAMGADLSLGDDFCSFTFLFPLENGYFGVKTRDYITSYTLSQLPLAMRQKYEEFMNEGTLQVFDGTVLDMMQVYDDLDAYILQSEYDVRAFGYDPYNAKEFVERWAQENGPFGIEKVIQGARTESVPLGELKKLSEQRKLLFDEALMEFAMGNCITLEDTNGNRKLYKQRHDKKIDAVAALMDAYVAWKLNRDAFE